MASASETAPTSDRFGQLGPNRVRIGSVELDLGDLGTNSVDLYRPNTDARHPLVVFGTGLGSAQALARSTAVHLATWGFAVAVPNLSRNSNPIRGGRILSAVVNRLPASAPDLDPGRVAVAGHSFDGLSATLAAQNERVRALVAFDPNDNVLQGLPGRDGADAVNAPALFVFGRRSLLNVRGPGIFEALGSEEKFSVRFPDVGHMDFVSRDDVPDSDEQRRTLSPATSFLLDRL
ncbi:MAG: hypothetical protein AAFQ82_13600 [Myxococcota bacterium]